MVAEVAQSFVLDNGAYSIWRQGGTLDVPGYLAWVEEWHRHPGFDWALIPDVIEGNEADNDELLALWPRHLQGVPVWHLHESLERLRRLGDEWHTVALGSSGAWATPGTPSWWERMDSAMVALCDIHGRPPCHLHGLRMLDPKIFTRLPLSSADSTNAAVNSGSKDRFGIYLPPTASQRGDVIASRIESFNSATHYRPISRSEELPGLFEEGILAATSTATGLHEEIADHLKSKLGGCQTLRAYHHGVSIETRR